MISHNPNERPDATKINSWVKEHILNMSTGLADTSPKSRGSGDHFTERSVSSPAEIASTVIDKNSLAKKKEKFKFYKTQSVT